MVLLSDALPVVKECLGTCRYCNRRERDVPEQGGLRCEALQLPFQRWLFHSDFLPTLPKGLTNIPHNHFWDQPVQLFCCNNGILSGDVNLGLFFLISHESSWHFKELYPRVWYRECLVTGVDWRKGRNSLPRYRQGLRGTKGNKCRHKAVGLIGCKQYIWVRSSVIQGRVKFGHAHFFLYLLILHQAFV